MPLVAGSAFNNGTGNLMPSPHIATRHAAVVVIGAGMAGLSAAWALLQSDPHQSSGPLVLLEAQARAGGLAASESWRGFLLERGPDSFLRHKPAAMALCRDLGLESELIAPLPAPAGARLLFERRWEPLPAGWRMIEPTLLEPCLDSPWFSPEEKAELASRWSKGAQGIGGAELSVAGYLRARYGERAGGAIARRIAGPLLAGVYGGDVEELSYAALQLGHTRPAAGGSPFVSLRGGMGALPEALAAALARRLPPAALQYKRRVAAITHAATGGGYQVELADGAVWHAARLVLAVPAWTSARLLRRLDPDLAGLLAAIPYRSSLNLNLAYRETPALPSGHGFLVSEGNGLRLLACTFAHQKFPGRAPAGAALLRLFYGEEEASWPRARLLELALTELKAALGVAARPDAVRIERCRRAMPQYTVGHAERLTAIHDRLERHPGLQLAGNAYQGVGVPDCIASGIAAAERLQLSLA